jgi:MFS family permease
MLKDLNLSYLQWAIITFCSSFASLVLMPTWGKFSDKYGNLTTLKLTGVVIPFVPLLWVFSMPILNAYGNSQLFLVLCIFELISGAVWAGFNLSASNFIYDAVTRQRTAICSAYYTLICAFGTFIGATVGGILCSQEIYFFSYGAIVFVFVISSIMRMIVYLFMIKRIKEVREVECFNLKECVREKFTHWNYKRILDLFIFKQIQH